VRLGLTLEAANRYGSVKARTAAALLDTLASPTIAAVIDARIAAIGITDAYLVNLGVILCREVRIHHALPSGPVRERRLAALDRLFRRWRHRLQARTP
jgi:hypothetical protein